MRTEYDDDREKIARDTGLKCEDESLAQQSMAKEADINTIVKRFGLSGQLPLMEQVPTLADFAGIIDYKTALDAVIRLRESFEDVPADVRSRFGNDPQQFVEFCSDPRNLAELRKLGIAKPEAVVQNAVAPAVPA